MHFIKNMHLILENYVLYCMYRYRIQMKKEELEKEKQEAPVTDGTQQPTETEQAKEETAETPAAQ